MRCRLIPGLVVLVGLPVVIAAQDMPAGPELFPVAIGSRWTYRIQGQEDKLVVVAAGFEKLGDARCIRLEGRLRDRLIATEHVAVRKDGAYRYRCDGADIEPPLLLAKFPPAKGTKWHMEYKVGDKKAAIKFEYGAEEVTVPAGRYKAVVVRSEVADSGVTNTCWYAPRVGLVKQVIDDGESEIVLLLEKFDRFNFKKP